MICSPGTEVSPPYPPESLTVDQVRYALSQWFLSLRYGRHARRILLEDAAALTAYHRRQNTEAKLSHTRTMRQTLLESGIDVDRIRSCLESNFALYCHYRLSNEFSNSFQVHSCRVSYGSRPLRFRAGAKQ